MRYILRLFAVYWLGPALLAQAPGNPGANFCSVSSAPTAVRAEGIAELAADILIQCSAQNPPGTQATASDVAMTLSVGFNVDVTNDINFGAGAAIADAVLVVNENNCAAPSAVGGAFGTCGAPNTAFQDPQFGSLVAAKRLTWLGVRVPVPEGPGPNGPNPSTTTIRITGVRVRASQLGVPNAAVIPSTQVTASVSLSASGFQLTNNLVNVGLPILSLMTSLPGSSSGRQCQGGPATVPLILREGLAPALRPDGPPTFFPEQGLSESGYFAAAAAGRVLLRFYNVPQGAQLTLPKLVETGDPAVNGDALRLQWVDGAAADGAGGTASSQTGDVALSPSTGFAFAIYEVTDANPAVLESAPVPVTVGWTGSAAAGVIRMSAYPAPLSAVAAPDRAAPEPRFLDAAALHHLFSIAPCSTGLLFPFAISQGAEDTRLILDNASGDVPGTSAQSGACTLRYFGTNAPADQTTAPLAPGSQIEVALSSAAPGFAGYVLADCGFEGAAGKAVVQNGGGASYEGEAERISSNGSSPPPGARPLLFPYAVDGGGFDTRIVLSNATLGPAGANPQAGVCRIDYFGQNAPASQISTMIPPGDQLSFTLSAGNAAMGVPGAPGFSGYVIAVCEPSRMLGFATITESSGSQPVAGYSFEAEAFDAPLIVDPIEDPAGQTALLLPFVSTRGTYETRLAITNASLDALGAPPRAGSCTLAYHGDVETPAPGPQTIGLAAGEQAVFALSEGSAAYTVAPAPNFQGYLTIDCDFDRARAVALVRSESGGTAQAAFAEKAEVLAVPRDPASQPFFNPYLSNQAGEDRIIVLTGSSVDELGSTPANGVCGLAFRGASAPGAANAPLAAGATRVFVLSRGLPALGIPPAPGFKGFLAGACDVGLVRATDYRVAPQTNVAPFCELDATPGVQPSDIVALSNLLGQAVPLGHPADPDGDALATTADVQYCNSLSIAAQPTPAPEPDPDPGPASDPDPQPSQPPPLPPPGADLQVRIEPSSNVATPQRRLGFRVRVSNTGPAAATGVMLLVDLPPALSLRSSPAECNGQSASQTCELGEIPAGRSVSLAFTGNVAAGARTALTAYAQASSPIRDPNPANNVSSRTVPLASQVDIAANAYLLPRFPAPGESATLTVSVTNRGPAAAEGVRLEAQIAGAFQLQQTPMGCSFADGALTCAVGALQAGRTRAYLLQVRYLPGGGVQGDGGATSTMVSGTSSSSEVRPENNVYSLSVF